MPLTQPQTQEREAEVVPVDDEADAAPPQRKPRDHQRRKRRRILHQHQVRLRQPAQYAPQPEALAHGVEQAATA
jgi:hypothetical protein